MPYLRAFLFAFGIAVLTYVSLSNNPNAMPTTEAHVAYGAFINVLVSYGIGYGTAKRDDAE